MRKKLTLEITSTASRETLQQVLYGSFPAESTNRRRHKPSADVRFARKLLCRKSEYEFFICQLLYHYDHGGCASAEEAQENSSHGRGTKKRNKQSRLQEKSAQLGTSSLRYPYMYYAALLVQVQLPARFSGEAQIYFRIKKAEPKRTSRKPELRALRPPGFSCSSLLGACVCT